MTSRIIRLLAGSLLVTSAVNMALGHRTTGIALAVVAFLIVWAWETK